MERWYEKTYAGACGACGAWHELKVKPGSAMGTTSNYRAFLDLDCISCGLHFTINVLGNE